MKFPPQVIRNGALSYAGSYATRLDGCNDPGEMFP
jgi:hypothetical protein